MESYRGILYDMVEGVTPGMTDMTILQAQSKILNLERDILDLVKKFEEDTDLRVSGIELDGGDDEKTVTVEALVLL